MVGAQLKNAAWSRDFPRIKTLGPYHKYLIYFLDYLPIRFRGSGYRLPFGIIGKIVPSNIPFRCGWIANNKGELLVRLLLRKKISHIFNPMFVEEGPGMVLKTLNKIRHLAIIHRVGAHFKIGARDCLLCFYQNSTGNKE